MATTADDGIDLGRAIGLTEACKLMRGRGGKAPSVETVRRWANPKRGCRPQGQGGPQLVLCSIRVNGEVLTLPEWVEAFERERARLGARPRPEPFVPPRSAKKRAADQRRAAARLDRDGVGGAQEKAGL